MVWFLVAVLVLLNLALFAVLCVVSSGAVRDRAGWQQERDGYQASYLDFAHKFEQQKRALQHLEQRYQRIVAETTAARVGLATIATLATKPEGWLGHES